MQVSSDAIANELFAVVKDRDHARRALDEVRAMPDATEVMRDAAYEALSRLIDQIEQLRRDFDAALDAELAALSQPATVAIAADDLAALIAVVKAQIVRDEVRERTRGVSWVLRDETDALRALVARVSATGESTIEEAA